MKRVTWAFTVAVLLFTAMPAARTPPELVVMTRNQYLGADLAPILAAATPLEFIAAVQAALAQIAAADFPERAAAFADEIVERRPHLIGLQEVFRLDLNGTVSAPPFRDQLEDLLDALAARGAEYYVAAQVKNLDITIPVPGMGAVRGVDRDVVLARADVTTWPASFAGCRTSLDGCNFQVVAAAPSPVGPIPIERGFVAVHAAVDGHLLRFVNTHLEIPELPVVIQAAQASELIARLAATAQPDLPNVIVGDINSAPTDVPAIVNGQSIAPPYQQLRSAGYLDTWTLRPGNPPGYTCCQTGDLRNAESALFKRVDVVFISGLPHGVHANVIGADAEDRTVSGLWPSDHAGVVTRLWW